MEWYIILYLNPVIHELAPLSISNMLKQNSLKVLLYKRVWKCMNVYQMTWNESAFHEYKQNSEVTFTEYIFVIPHVTVLKKVHTLMHVWYCSVVYFNFVLKWIVFLFRSVLVFQQMKSAQLPDSLRVIPKRSQQELFFHELVVAYFLIGQIHLARYLNVQNY